MKKILTNNYITLLTLLVLGAFLRFYNLLWGSPYFFHPDERNIIYAISQLSFPNQLNPHFFAYGSLLIYVVYLTSTLAAFLLHQTVSFALLIFWLRFFTALLSTLMILSLFFIGSTHWNKQVGLLSALLATFSVGLIQFAHFGTFELWTAFFSIWLFYFSLLVVKHYSLKNIFITGALTGILLSIKISNAVVISIPVICVIACYVKSHHKKIFRLISHLILYFLIIAVVYSITNPYALLDFKDFAGSINYESSVALGSLPVFYTGSFFNTIPVFFQFTKVYPFLLNPLLTILFIPAFFFISFKGFKHKNNPSILLTIYYLLLFLSQGTLFVKWTRYMIPTLPFMYLIIAVWIANLPITVKRFLYEGVGAVAIIYAFAFFYTVYLPPDTRIVAAEWAQKNLSSSDSIVTEPYDLGILPFNSLFPNIVQMPIYDIDQNSEAFATVQQNLANADVLILPSQRLIHSRVPNKNNFPEGNMFYTKLLSNQTAYKKIYQTQCDIFCKITYMGDPLFNVEETANVFDRPTVMIFEKEKL